MADSSDADMFTAQESLTREGREALVTGVPMKLPERQKQQQQPDSSGAEAPEPEKPAKKHTKGKDKKVSFEDEVPEPGKPARGRAKGKGRADESKDEFSAEYPRGRRDAEVEHYGFQTKKKEPFDLSKYKYRSVREFDPEFYAKVVAEIEEKYQEMVKMFGAGPTIHMGKKGGKREDQAKVNEAEE